MNWLEEMCNEAAELRVLWISKRTNDSSLRDAEHQKTKTKPHQETKQKNKWIKKGWMKRSNLKDFLQVQW